MTNEEAISVIENEIQIDVRLCTDKQVDKFQTALYMAISALRAEPTGDALTLEQLRGMDGQTVWVEEVKHWALIDIEKGGQWDGIPFAVWAENGTKFTYNVESRDLHCYRRPPEGEEDA